MFMCQRGEKMRGDNKKISRAGGGRTYLAPPVPPALRTLSDCTCCPPSIGGAGGGRHRFSDRYVPRHRPTRKEQRRVEEEEEEAEEEEEERRGI